MTLPASSVLPALHHLTNSHSLWQHPFLLKCRLGQLTESEVYCLAVGMYQFCREFNRILAGVLSCCSEESVQLVILENLYDEMGAGNANNSHPALFRHFTRELGIDDDILETLPTEPETQTLITTYLNLPHQYGYLAALGAICFASEGIVNVLYKQLQNGVTSSASFPPESLVFFDLHLDLDGVHAAKLESIIRDRIQTAQEAKRVQRAIGAAMNARVRFFDGIERQASQFASLATSSMMSAGL